MKRVGRIRVSNEYNIHKWCWSGGWNRERDSYGRCLTNVNILRLIWSQNVMRTGCEGVKIQEVSNARDLQMVAINLKGVEWTKCVVARYPSSSFRIIVERVFASNSGLPLRTMNYDQRVLSASHQFLPRMIEVITKYYLKFCQTRIICFLRPNERWN